MAARHRHHIKAPAPTWLLPKATPPPARDAAKKTPAPAYSPILLSPSVWQKAQNDRHGRAEPAAAGVPASPRIGCMGQVKGSRMCSSARGHAARGPQPSAPRAGGSLAGLLTGLFGRRRKATKARSCSKVRDVPSDSLTSGSNRGSRAPAVPPRQLDPPLPVVRRPARDGSAPSLWERRRGGAGALEGLQLK